MNRSDPGPCRAGHTDQERLRELLGARALGQLGPDERAEIDGHLAHCPACREDLAGLSSLAAPLARIDPDATTPAPAGPSPQGFAAIMERIGREQAADAPTAAPPTVRLSPLTGMQPHAGIRPTGTTTDGDHGAAAVVPLAPRRRRVSVQLLAAASVLVVALAGLGATFATGLSDGPDPEPVTVQALAPGITATAGTIDHTWGVEMVLTATGFTPGSAYQVSVLDQGGRPVQAGSFLGTGDQEMVCRLNSSLPRGQADGFVVTDAAGNEVLRSTFT